MPWVVVLRTRFMLLRFMDTCYDSMTTHLTIARQLQAIELVDREHITGEDDLDTLQYIHIHIYIYIYIYNASKSIL